MLSDLPLKDKTYRLLSVIKKKERLKSYDETIRWLIQTNGYPVRSALGTAEGMRWEKRDRLDFHED